MLSLGIETSCDETAAALVTGAGEILANQVLSQNAAHQPYGGVVPEIASREHLSNWPRVSAEALDIVGQFRGPLLAAYQFESAVLVVNVSAGVHEQA